MLSYLLKILVLIIFSGIIIINYYFWSETRGAHIESFTWYIKYFLPFLFTYTFYKCITLFSGNKIITFTPIKILWFFILQLIILSSLFFSYNWTNFSWAFWNGLNLFIQILWFSILPLTIMFVSIAFWTKVLDIFLNPYKEKSENYRFLTASWIWFFLFMFWLTILWMIWMYNIYSLFWIIALFWGFWYRELVKLFIWFWTYKIEIKNHDLSSDDLLEKINPKLLWMEFFFVIITLILSINLISIMRPFPIWWDDLWAYMNYAQLMWNSGIVWELGSMMSWQTFTGIWYMFNNPTQAFFLNSLGGFMSVIVIVLVVSEIFKEKKKTLIHLPLLAGTLFISMPMIIFQQAKDMKLDAGLFFIWIIALYMLFEFYLWYNQKKKEKKLLTKTEVLKIFFIVWLLLGFTFTIKFTSLLLISAVFWILFYTRLWILWFFWYISLFFAIFTAGWLWSMMNVVISNDNLIKLDISSETIISLIWTFLWIPVFYMIDNIASIIWLIFWIIFLGIARFVRKKRFRTFLPRVIALSIWIGVAILPWWLSNIISSVQNGSGLNVQSLIWWSAKRFDIDYSKIYSTWELENIENQKEQEWLWSSGTTTNEDWGRYFGYEQGINNYVKFPWNLTMQNNQWGEFTTVWFIFLALLPTVFLFLPFRRKEYALWIVFLLILEVLVFVKFSNNLIPTEEISHIKKEQSNFFLEKNSTVFEDNFFSANIYDIDINNYISEEAIDTLIDYNSGNYREQYNEIFAAVSQKFYSELSKIIIEWKKDYSLELVETKLLWPDILTLQNIEKLYNEYYIFNNKYPEITTQVQKNLTEQTIEPSENIINLWKEYRTINQFFTDIMSWMNLPYWYIYLLFIILCPLAFFLPTLKKKQLSTLFKINLIFTIFYTFLWWISAFWVVWYWIIMYFNFILMILFWAYYITWYEKSDSENTKWLRLLWSFVFWWIILIYIFGSVFPHSFTNLKSAWYSQYKTWETTVSEAPYAFHPEYFIILYNLNIDSSKNLELVNDSIVSKEIISIVNGNNLIDDIVWIKAVLTQIIGDERITDIWLKNAAYNSLQNLYKNISHPKEEYKSTSWIYRIWTFLKYHISENNKRLLEDSLVSIFDTYIYDENVDVSVERIKKLWIDYFLVDLNAATIDQDPRHALTARYENLLTTFTSSKLELVETDSVCMKIGLEKYEKSKNISEYLELAWVNYDWYSTGEKISRGIKQRNCYMDIITIIESWEVNEISFSYLNLYVSHINKMETLDEKLIFLQRYAWHWSKALFKIK